MKFRIKISPRVIRKMIKASKKSQGFWASLVDRRRETVNRWCKGLQQPDMKSYRKLCAQYDHMMHRTGIFAEGK
jgi:hypothetical protein